jgi:hypothetical protein
MTPAKIVIQGDYWDCQIYRGRLYLFTIEGTIKTIHWHKLIEELKNDEYINIALTYAFENGRNLYHQELHDLFKDQEIKQLLRTKFGALSERNLLISEDKLDQFLIGEQETPFHDLHVDSDVFSNRLYVLSHNSLLSSAVHTKSKKYPVANTVQKHFDLYGFSICANRYAQLAISAGDDGLMEYNGSSTIGLTFFDDRRMSQVSKRHSSFADYSFLSIYNSSLAGDSFLSYFRWNENVNKPERVNKGEFDEANIFNNDVEKPSYLSWGSNEKIYRAVQGGLEIVRFNNYAKPHEPIFSEKKFIGLQE